MTKFVPNLLIVEDNIAVAEVIELLCIDHEHKEIAYNGKSALDLLEWAHVVCVDGNFPDSDLFYFALINSGKPFIIYSGEEKNKGKGELMFILKPDINALKIGLKNLLERFFK